MEPHLPERRHDISHQRMRPVHPSAGETGEYYHFPDPARLPLIVAARMSLSFPFLISGVPLWRRDFTLLEEAERNKLRRCFFSDGGLSSNFPIHFFDHLLPNSPTFAISLDDYDAKRNRGQCLAAANRRQRNPGAHSAFRGPRRIPDAALWCRPRTGRTICKATLPGYRERIAHVVLKPEAGWIESRHG